MIRNLSVVICLVVAFVWSAVVTTPRASGREVSDAEAMALVGGQAAPACPGAWINYPDQRCNPNLFCQTKNGGSSSCANVGDICIRCDLQPPTGEGTCGLPIGEGCQQCDTKTPCGKKYEGTCQTVPPGVLVCSGQVQKGDCIGKGDQCK